MGVRLQRRAHPGNVPLGVAGIIRGTTGVLNGLGVTPDGTPTCDPNHGLFADYESHPVLLADRTDDDVHATIRIFAADFAGGWSRRRLPGTGRVAPRRGPPRRTPPMAAQPAPSRPVGRRPQARRPASAMPGVKPAGNSRSHSAQQRSSPGRHPGGNGMTPQRRRRLRSEQIVLLVAAAIAIPAIVWAAVRLAASDDASRPVEAGAGEPGVSHVHGLGINPADGSLIVATHFGSFRIAPGGDDAVRIGDSFQDTMGFTVAGPNRFLGSGHPDVAGSRRGQPTRLGLIESTDAGASWTAISLSGEVDFHGLAFAHGQIYGWDSSTGRFMVSSNQRDWDTRSTLDLFGFAVDPDNPDHILGAGSDGLTESVDGGRTWNGSEGPQLVTLSCDRDAGLWGADLGGIVWHRVGSEWNRAGALPGEPQALLATPDALYAAAHDENGVTGIYRSTDDGRSWDLRYRDAS